MPEDSIVEEAFDKDVRPSTDKAPEIEDRADVDVETKLVKVN